MEPYHHHTRKIWLNNWSDKLVSGYFPTFYLYVCFYVCPGVMKKAVKWTAMDVDKSTSLNRVDRRPAGKEESGRRRPRKV